VTREEIQKILDNLDRLIARCPKKQTRKKKPAKK
jgi:hypothetical protein